MSLKFNKKEILLIPQIFVTGFLFYTFTRIHSYISKLVIGISNSFCERGYLFQAVTLFSLIYLFMISSHKFDSLFVWFRKRLQMEALNWQVQAGSSAIWILLWVQDGSSAIFCWNFLDGLYFLVYIWLSREWND